MHPQAVADGGVIVGDGLGGVIIIGKGFFEVAADIGGGLLGVSRCCL